MAGRGCAMHLPPLPGLSLQAHDEYPGLTPGVFGTDPVLDADAYGNFYYVSINFEEMRLFRSADGGVTWGTPIQTFSRFRDKPWLLVTHRPEHDHPIILITWSRTSFQVSFDGGISFTEPSSSGTWGTMAIDSTGGLHIVGEPKLISSSLDALVPDGIPSFDWRVLPFPGALIASSDANSSGLLGMLWVATHRIATASHDNLYVLGPMFLSSNEFGDVYYQSDVYFVRSTDAGTTWEAPIRVNDDPEGNGAWQWFGMMSVAPNGRIDAVWNDTRNYPDAPNSRLSEVFYAYSTDDGTTWSKNVPVSPGFDSRIGWPRQRKIGDYYHMRSDNLGVNVAYAATFNGAQYIWFLRIGPHDCNANEMPDTTDIERGISRDRNGNGIPDECELFGDFNGDSRLDLRDYQGMQLCLGAPSADLPGPRCSRLDLDGDVDLNDYRALAALVP